jgi:hypothetical protein
VIDDVSSALPNIMVMSNDTLPTAIVTHVDQITILLLERIQHSRITGLEEALVAIYKMEELRVELLALPGNVVLKTLCSMCKRSSHNNESLRGLMLRVLIPLCSSSHQVYCLR